jgi:hypothetical protein
MSGSKEYTAWGSMITRTTNPRNKRWARYGGIGITVCAEWLSSFEQFLSDMGLAPTKNHQLDRIENNKGYYPGNCRWATRVEQARNTSTSVFIEYQGASKTIAEWSEITGIERSLLHWRLKRGWPVHRAFTEQATLGKNQY